jgi:hypothetical protein
MSKDLPDLLKERQRSFEEAYFSKRDSKLIQKIREHAQLQDVAVALAEKLQVDAPDLLQRVVGLGLTRETGAALLVAPLVQVAWADGEVSAHERAVVLELAAERGIVAGTPAHAQLDAWLRESPGADVFDAAIDVINMGFAVLPPAEHADGVRALLEACERVASASGGLLTLFGLHLGTSGEEIRMLEALTKKLHSGNQRA